MEIDTSEEWKKVNKRECLVKTANAPSTCNGTLLEVEIMEWYRFVHENKTWDNASQNCRQIGGDLFLKLNGTVGQLEFLQNKLGSCGWIGGRAYSDGYIAEKVFFPVPKSKIIWAEGEPKKDRPYICHREVYTEVSSQEMPSVCDLLA